MRNANEKTIPMFREDAHAADFRGRVVCEEPHENFAKFNGTLYADSK